MEKQYKLSEKERAKGREYVRRYREKLRAEGKPTYKPRSGNSYKSIIARLYVDKYLSEHPCVDCGYSDPRALEFDHVRGKKSFEISVGVGRGFPLTKIMEEIQKCEVRCANCHRLRHKQQK